MFYEGDLQSGITLAVQQAKSVLCFVIGEFPISTILSLYWKLTDDFSDESPASKEWEVTLSDVCRELLVLS